MYENENIHVLLIGVHEGMVVVNAPQLRSILQLFCCPRRHYSTP